MKRKTKKIEIKQHAHPIHKKRKSSNKYLPEIMEKRYNIIIIILSILFTIIGGRLFQLQVLKSENYSENLLSLSEKTIESSSAPRGRIYDRNYNLLVDNEGIKTIYYKKPNDVTTKGEIELAYTVAEKLNIDYSKINDTRLKTFYYKSHYEKCRKKITDEEWDLYSKRKLDDNDINDLIYERLEEEIKEYNELDKEAAYIYYLMNKGYSYAEKIIKNTDVT